MTHFPTPGSQSLPGLFDLKVNTGEELKRSFVPFWNINSGENYTIENNLNRY